MPLITFEGLDASGKSTQLQLLQLYLAQLGYEVVCTRESGGTGLGVEIRQLVQERHDLIIHPLSEALLYAADRAQHVSELMRPALQRGAYVLCDRYIDSSLAFQGVSLPLAVIREINALATENLAADLTFLCDLGVSTARERLQQRETAPDRIELRDHSYHEQVRRIYLEIAASDPGRICVLDTSASVESVAEIVKNRVKTRFGIDDGNPIYQE